MSGGIDRIFPEPPHEIRGATPTDQAWIDETIEAGATCCGWMVKPRPNDLDPPAVKAAIAPPPPPAPSRVTAKPKKKAPLWMRMLHPKAR